MIPSTPNLFKSRKFWITIADAVFSLVTLATTLYLSQDSTTHAMVVGVIASFQLVVKALIDGIATEDAAFMSSEATRSVVDSNIINAAVIPAKKMPF